MRSQGDSTKTIADACKTDVYALEALLPAGVVQLFFESDCGKLPATQSDDWDALVAFLETHKLQAMGSSLVKLHQLDFLVRYRYLRASWGVVVCDVAILIHIRVYLIPMNFPGAHGGLVAHPRERQRVVLHGRKALPAFLQDTNRSIAAWARSPVPCDQFEPFLRQQPDTRTLSEIYGDLPSPTSVPSTSLSGIDTRTQKALSHALHRESPPGMRSLYAYQRRTVARMLQQELEPGIAPDPLYVPIHGVQIEGCSKVFYLQPSTLEILNECPMRAQAKGGILCEEMGTGKTCIVLGLIMATKHQLSSPEESLWDEPDRPILTPLAFCHFLTPRFAYARQVARVNHDQPSTFPSLVELLTHSIRASPELIGPSGFDESLRHCLPDHLWESIAANHPFYHVFERLPASSSPRRRYLDRGPRKVYLTSATLVIVPRAILEQWNSEINKHCDSGSIRHISIDNGPRGQPMPSAPILASMYDIVLVTYEKFAAEKSRCNPSSLHTWTHCQCSVIARTRVPRCTCHQRQNDASVSPLIQMGTNDPYGQIRWKRLVLDEGHVSAAATNLARLCQALNAERRWIVSGTPTRNLMGLSLGQSETSGNIEKISDPDDEDVGRTPTGDGEQVYPDPKDVEHILAVEGQLVYNPDDKVVEQIPAVERELVYPCDSNGPPRVWTRVDRDDLTKLGEMISKFIGVPQFAYETNLFRKMVAAPLLDRQGPAFGAIQVVSQVMGQVMFRHQISDVERELPDKLPPLKEKTISLKFHPLAAKTYNVLQAGIAVNAVDSERKDQDYLFHPRTRAALRLTLENMTQVMFWKTDNTSFDTEGALERAEEALKRARAKGLPESDIKLVEESIRVQREALNNHVWTNVMHCDDNPYVVRGLSSALQNAWSKLDAKLFEGCDALLDPERLCKLRDVLLRSPLIFEEQLIVEGRAVAEEEAYQAALYDESQRRAKRKARHDEGIAENIKVKRFNTIEKSTVEELDQELTATINRRERGEIEEAPLLSFEPATRTTGKFSSISVGKSASSKINYILKKVQKHAQKEKFLIFSAYPMSLAYIEEALKLAQVRYLKYTSRIKPHERQQSVVTFETSEKYRVLLMELKLGARGLNLVKASRIIFCEPVWQGDVESQAIKRAHRIGQRCRVLKVTTLVMCGTSEEAMVTRRHTLRRKSERLPAMEEDASLSKFLQNPTFLKAEHIEPPDIQNLEMPLISGLFATGARDKMPEDRGEVNVDEQIHTWPQGSGRLPKKRKMVHFG